MITAKKPTVTEALKLVREALSRLKPAEVGGSIQGGVVLLTATHLDNYIEGKRGSEPLNRAATKMYNELKKALSMSQEEYNAQY